MTSPSYLILAEAFNTQPREIPNFQVIAAGRVFGFDDIVTASICCHDYSGKLYSVIRDETAATGFRRIPKEPLSEAIARDCARRTPQKSEIGVRCVPVFGR